MGMEKDEGAELLPGQLMTGITESRWPPLWMPRGSVRALLALTAVGTYCALWVLRAYGVGDGPQEGLTAIVGGVLVYYFEQRRSETS